MSAKVSRFLIAWAAINLGRVRWAGLFGSWACTSVREVAHSLHFARFCTHETSAGMRFAHVT